MYQKYYYVSLLLLDKNGVIQLYANVNKYDRKKRRLKGIKDLKSCK